MDNNKDPVRIKSLTLKNAACFEDITLNFKERITVLIGPNGTGKTTLLNSIAVVLFGQLNSSALLFSPPTKDIKQKTEITLEYKNNKKIEKLGITYQKEGNLYVPSFGNMYGKNAEKVMDALHPFIFIPALREIKDVKIQGITEEQIYIANRRGMTKKILAGIQYNSGQGIKQWIVNRYFFRNEPWGGKDRIQLNHFTENINNLMPEYEQVKFKHVNEDMEPIFETNTGEITFGSFSSGEQSIILILWEILNSLQRYYPESMNPFEEPAIVVIDELDAHLHPEWQLVILDSLRNMFPGIQLIAATHSPLVVSGCKKDEAIFLKFDKEKKAAVIDESAPDNPRGWTVESLLLYAFGLSSVRNREAEEELDEIKKLLKKKILGETSEEENRNLEELKANINLAPDDPTLPLLDMEAMKEILEEENA